MVGPAKKKRSRSGVKATPEELAALPEDEFTRTYRHGVDPREYGWDQRADTNYLARVELWRHPATNIQVDYYFTTGKAKVVEKRSKFQEFFPVPSRAAAIEFWEGWADPEWE